MLCFDFRCGLFDVTVWKRQLRNIFSATPEGQLTLLLSASILITTGVLDTDILDLSVVW